MITMKMKINNIKPNPFKKMINEGKLSKPQMERIKTNLKELGLMGSIPVVKREDGYHMVYGHHRMKALEKEYGKNHEVEVTVMEYTDAQLFRGMIVENLTQRDGEFREERANIFAVRDFLTEHKEELERLRDSRSLSPSSPIKREYQNVPTSGDVSYWLGDIMAHDVVNNYLKTEVLTPEIVNNVENTHKGKTKKRRKGGVVSKSQAFMLSNFPDQEEQKDLWEVLKNSREQRVREQQKLLSQYKKAPDEIKQKIRNGDILIEHIEDECNAFLLKKQKKDFKPAVFIPNFAGRLKEFDNTVTNVEKHVSAFGSVFDSKQFKDRFETLSMREKTMLIKFMDGVGTRLVKCVNKVEKFREKIGEM